MSDRPDDTRRTVPRAACIGFTAWMLVWVPVIVATQGPQNFWWLCNVAQFLLLYSMWTSNRLIISSQAGTVVFIGLAWTLDVVAGMFIGDSPTGITAYMFDAEQPLAVRATSTYHVWLPALVIWLAIRQGYDRRGLWLQCAIGSAAIVGSALFGDPERNLNYTIAPFGIEQTWMPQPVYIPLLCIGTAVLIYLPGHLLMRWIVGRAAARKHILNGRAT